MSEVIVLTCASGKQCSHLLTLLYDYPKYKLRLVVHTLKSAQRLSKEYPRAEVLVVDFDAPEKCEQILDGATVLYYISPAFSHKETFYGTNMVDAAIAESKKPQSKFAHFVLSSVIHPEITKLLNHDRKRYIEEYLTESRLPYTVLQPSHFTDNTIGAILALKDEASPVYKHVCTPETAFSFTTLDDLAAASLRVIQERSKLFFATYQLVSTLPVEYSDYIHSIAEVMGKKIEIKQVPYEDSVEIVSARLLGMDNPPQMLRDGPERLLLYYNRRGLYGNPRIMEWLIGWPGMTPAQLAKKMLDEGNTSRVL